MNEKKQENKEITISVPAKVETFFKSEIGKKKILDIVPSHLKADRLVNVAISALKINPTLAQCGFYSICGSVVQAAQLGLEVNSPLGHAYLVPYKVKGNYECQLQIGYRGMLDIARRSGVVKSISARVVREGDFFEFEFGLNPKLRHIPARDAKDNVIYVYAVAVFSDGGTQFEVMDMWEVSEIKKYSKSAAYDSSPWKTHPDEMMKKTAIRRLFKYLPVSIEMQSAVGLDEMVDANVNQKNSVIVEGDGKNINDVVFGNSENTSFTTEDIAWEEKDEQSAKKI